MRLKGALNKTKSFHDENNWKDLLLNIVTVWKVFFLFSTHHHHHHLLALTKPIAYQLVYRQIFLNNSNQHISAVTMHQTWPQVLHI